MILTNFKTYESGTGPDALVLAKIHEEVAQQTGADIRIAVQVADLYRITQAVKIPVYAQHVDPVDFGSHTGFILPQSVKSAGAVGTLLNHSEHPLERYVLAQAIEKAKAAGLEVILCAKDPQEGASFLGFETQFIAVEPPELIGGDISVSTAQPEVIQTAVEMIGGEKLLVGAGVKTAADVAQSRQLGAKGVLLASGVTLAENPKTALLDLVRGLN